MSSLDAAIEAATRAIVADWEARHRARIDVTVPEHAASFARQAVIAALSVWIPGAARRELGAALRQMPAGLDADTECTNLVAALLAAAFHGVPEADPLDAAPPPASQCKCPSACGQRGHHTAELPWDAART